MPINAEEAIEPMYPNVRKRPEAVPIWSAETCVYNAVWLPLAIVPIVTPKIRVISKIQIIGVLVVRKSTPMEATMEDTAATMSGPRTKFRFEIGPTTNAESPLIGSRSSPASSADIPRAAPIHSVTP